MDTTMTRRLSGVGPASRPASPEAAAVEAAVDVPPTIAAAQARIDELNAQRPERLADVAERVKGAQAALDELDLTIGEAHAALQVAVRRHADEQTAAAVVEQRRDNRAVAEIEAEQETLAHRYEARIAELRELAPALIETIEGIWACRREDNALYARRQAIDTRAAERQGLRTLQPEPCPNCAAQQQPCRCTQAAWHRLNTLGDEWTFGQGQTTLGQLRQFAEGGRDLVVPAEPES